MDFLNFVIALHKRLGVEIPEADYPQLASIDGVVSYLVTRMGLPMEARAPIRRAPISSDHAS